MTDPSLELSAVKYEVGSALSGTIGLNVQSASIMTGDSAFTAEVDGFSGKYDLATSAFTLKADEAKLKLGEILNADATGLALSYDPAASPPLSVATDTVTLTSDLFPKIKGVARNFLADADGVSFDDASLVSDPSDSTIDIGGVIEATGLSVGVTGFDYRTNPGPGQPAFVGTVGVHADSVSLFPGGSQPFSADVTGFNGSYDLNAKSLSLGAGEVDIRVGSSNDPIATVTATGLGFTLTPQTDGSESVAVTIGDAMASFPKLGVSGDAEKVTIDNTGFHVGSATLSATSAIAFGDVFSVDKPSVTVTNFGYTFGQAPTFDGTVEVKADEVDLKIGGAASAKATGVDGWLTFAPATWGTSSSRPTRWTSRSALTSN